MDDNKNYYCRLINKENQQELEEVAQIMSDVFTGVQVGERYISEPMVKYSGIQNESYKDFLFMYLKQIVRDELTVVAIDKKTDRVIGAIISENFNPNAEPPNFEGELTPYIEIMEFITELEHKFIHTIENSIINKVKPGDFVHIILLGVKSERQKARIAMDLLDLVETIAKEKGYKGLFAEATNFKSQKVFTEFSNYIVPYNNSHEAVALKYNNYKAFSKIPKDIAIECQIVYKALHDKFSL